MYLDDVQLRLTILYTLHCFKISMTEEMLMDTLVFSNLVDYFTMVDFLLDMQKLGLVSTVAIEGKTRYDITEKGKQTLAMFKKDVPKSVRDNIYDQAEASLSKLARGREIVADIQPVDDKKFLAKCGIYESGVPLIELNLFAGSRKQAKDLAKKFEKEAGQLYKIILERLIES